MIAGVVFPYKVVDVHDAIDWRFDKTVEQSHYWQASWLGHVVERGDVTTCARNSQIFRKPRGSLAAPSLRSRLCTSLWGRLFSSCHEKWLWKRALTALHKFVLVDYRDVKMNFLKIFHNKVAPLMIEILHTLTNFEHVIAIKVVCFLNHFSLIRRVVLGHNFLFINMKVFHKSNQTTRNLFHNDSSQLILSQLETFFSIITFFQDLE